ncbi:hypothetical protein [Helicobacter sp. T3_23-1059]
MDCHAKSNDFARNDGIVSPSLAEGARGWVFLDFTSVIVDFLSL